MAFFLIACDSKLPVVDPPVVIPACVGGEKQWTSLTDVMGEDWTEFNVIFDNGGVNPTFPFLKKGRINIGYGSVRKGTVPYSIPQGSTSEDGFNQACENLSNQYRGPFLNYVMGMDRFLYLPLGYEGVVGWSNGPNHPENYSNWSFIFSGKIQSTHGKEEEGQEVVEWCYVHEVGHQIAITDHGPHTGNDADHCIMQGEYESGILSRFQFCDRHICIMYNQFNDYLEKLNSNFSCEISLDKAQYIEGEAVWASLKVKNESSKRDSLPYLVGSFLIGERMKVTNESGKVSSYHGSSGPLLTTPYRHFMPYEDTTFHIELSNNFGFEYEINSYDYGRMISYFPPGNYTVQFILNEAGLMSNAVSFTVTAPNEAESTRLAELRTIYGIKERKERIEKYHSFIENNKGSVYIPQTVWVMNFCYGVLYLGGMRLDDKIIQVNKYFLDNYSNSFYSSLVIHTIWRYEYQQTKSETIANRTLKEIIQKHSGTFAAKMADWWLNSKEPSLKDLEPESKKK